MHRVGRWLDRGRAYAATTASTQSFDSLAEAQNLENALKAVELIMDDDIDGAEKGLADGTSAFHKLARGTLGFMKATLGFEQEVMKDASDQLYEAEHTATTSMYKAQHDSKAFISNIYEKGSEFQLCQAEAQVMTAVVGVLNESLTESIKGFYKLRKAYMALDSLVQMEINFMRTRGVRSLANSRAASSENLVLTPKSEIPKPVKSQEAREAKHPSNLRNAEVISPEKDEAEDDDEFFEADQDHPENPILDSYAGKLQATQDYMDHLLEDLDKPDYELEAELNEKLKLNEASRPDSSHYPRAQSLSGSLMLNLDADSDVFSNSLDVFIHSGTNLMFGVLNLMISMIPPAFGKLLYIVGFRGDRDRGLRMLWQASKFSNVNGGMAGLVIFGWYNAIVGFCDILSDSDPSDPESVAGYPQKRLENLLKEMRERHPQSFLWLIEEARMAAGRKDLDKALELLSRPGRSKLKQLKALHMFEMSLDSMYAHNYHLCFNSFLECVELNGWSQALYYYIAASACLQQYRTSTNKAEQRKMRQLAEEHYRTSPTKVGRKKMMGRQLPFEVFVVRKLAKWEERAARMKCDFLDAIGVSPLEEMVYLWGGYKKMPREELEKSLGNLEWSEKQPQWKDEDVDERAILALLRGVVFRNLGRHEESMELLKRELVDKEPGFAKGPQKDDWPQPAGHYEAAVGLWMMRTGYQTLHGGGDGSQKIGKVDIAHDTKLVEQAKQYVEKAKNWEHYDLDARIGMKITAALTSIRHWEQTHLRAQ